MAPVAMAPEGAEEATVREAAACVVAATPEAVMALAASGLVAAAAKVRCRRLQERPNPS